MQPSTLDVQQFGKYPPLARQIAVENIALLRELPLAFAPLLLRELIGYDWKFPAERREIDSQFKYLASLTPQQRVAELQPFAQLSLSSNLENLDWINDPAGFSERLSAHLWTSHQMDGFRTASLRYVDKVHAATPKPVLPFYRLGIVIVGGGVAEATSPLFRKLRPQGVYFSNVDAANGRAVLLDLVRQRAARYPIPFGHWYIDGAKNQAEPGITAVCYSGLDQVRIALVDKMREVMQPGNGGPEYLRSLLARMRPEDFGLPGNGEAGVLNRFQVSVLTEGSGTQLFSTTFVQWTAREALRRAQPLTLLARFTPRQHEQSMRDLLAGVKEAPQLDPQGSLVDANMGAYYTWINQQRLAGAEQSRFLVWFENHKEVLAIAPGLQHGSVDNRATTLPAVLAKMTDQS
ncbi:MAG TPA: hypothetical protein VFA65_19830 [Bryobacteraceae bacterium]|nr:hypothetical protein [Bryobacteraceae bacterium]